MRLLNEVHVVNDTIAKQFGHLAPILRYSRIYSRRVTGYAGGCDVCDRLGQMSVAPVRSAFYRDAFREYLIRGWTHGDRHLI